MAAVAHRSSVHQPEGSRHAGSSSTPVSRKKTTSNSTHRDDAKMIGQWRIGRTIGKGSSGRVKIAKHAITGKYAAIKIVPKGLIISSRMSVSEAGARADKVLLGIEREIVIMKLIDHPNVLSLFDVWETSTELYLIMEYVPGGELFDYLVKRGRLPVSEALHYFQQIIHAVDYCHRFNICHRDLKPENLLLDKDKNIKVADFGMAAWEAGERMLETSCGSPHYASPEIVAGKAYHGSSSDIWSCGIILFALLTGRLPFDDDNIRSLLQKVKIGSFEMPDEIKDPARDLLFKMLEKDPERRITMPDILKHPFFVSRPIRPIPGRSLVSPPSLNEVERPVNSPEEIDPDIMGNLKTLWHGASDEEIVAALMSREKTWEKAIYHLLVKYRNKHLENYNMDEEAEQRPSKVASPPKRKGSAKPRPLGENTTIQDTTTPMVVRPSAPTPKKASANAIVDSPASRPTSKLAPNGPRPPMTNRGSVYSSSGEDSTITPTTPAIVLQEATPTKEPVSRPVSVASTLPLNVPQVQDEQLQQFFNQVATQLNTMNIRSSVASGSSSSSAILGSDYQAYLSFVGGGSAVAAPTSGASPTIMESPEEEDTNQFADADDDNSDVASIHSTLSATVVPQHSPLIGLGLGAPPRLYPAPPPNQQRWSYQSSSNNPTSPRPPSPARFESAPAGGLPSPPIWSSNEAMLAPRPPRLASRPAPAPPPRGASRPAPLQLDSLPRDGSYVVVESAANVASDPMASWSSKPSTFSSKSQDAFGMLKKKKNKDTLSPMSPEIASPTFTSPKRSWFNNLFSFKPTPMGITSPSNISETRENVKKALFNMGVQVQVIEIDSIRALRCRLDEVRDSQGNSTTKGVRFRIEFARGAPIAKSVGYHTLVSLTQEKGAQSSFKDIAQALKSVIEDGHAPPIRPTAQHTQSYIQARSPITPTSNLSAPPTRFTHSAPTTPILGHSPRFPPTTTPGSAQLPSAIRF